MGAIRAAIGDGVLTFMWVFCASTIGAATSVIATAVGVQGAAALLITISLLYMLLLIIGVIGVVLGGAAFNPSITVAFYAAGHGRKTDTLISAAIRFPAQALGALGAVLAIVELMPLEHKYMLGGPSLKVDLHSGAIAEVVLTFAISFLVLYISFKGPKNPLMKCVLLSMSIVTMVAVGSGYTGPSMNPAYAFGWAYVNNRHNTWEHLYVYWICPFVGAILAGWVFRVFFPLPSKKKKTA